MIPEIVISLQVEGDPRIRLDALTYEDELALRRWLSELGTEAVAAAVERGLDELGRAA